MQIIENKKLSEIIKNSESIGVDTNSGMIVAVNSDNNPIDITNYILELIVPCIEDNQTFILWNRKINISVCEVY